MIQLRKRLVGVGVPSDALSGVKLLYTLLGCVHEFFVLK